MSNSGVVAKVLFVFSALSSLSQASALDECMNDVCGEGKEEFSTLQAMRWGLPRLTTDHVAMWNEYVAAARRAAHFGLQPDCEPLRLEASAGTAYKGVAVLLHGFTACPSQWNQIARMLSERGYEVLVPLLPGHGHALLPPGHEIKGTCMSALGMNGNCPSPLDDVDSLPTSSLGYRNFAQTINDVVRRAPVGVHVVAGLSVGAALAVHAGQATNTNGDAIYQRQLILAPMLNATDPLLKLAVKLSLSDQYMGFGGWCVENRLQGAAGICSFKLKHALAALDFGAETLARVFLPKGAEVSVHYGLADPNDPRGARALVDKYRQSGRPVHTCVWPFQEHVMISLEASLDVNKWFLPKVVCQVVNWLANGTPIPQTTRKEASEDNVNICELGCDNTTCPEIKHLKKGDVPLLTCPDSP